MRLSCPACGRRLHIDDDLFPEDVQMFRITCPRCDEPFCVDAATRSASLQVDADLAGRFTDTTLAALHTVLQRMTRRLAAFSHTRQPDAQPRRVGAAAALRMDEFAELEFPDDDD